METIVNKIKKSVKKPKIDLSSLTPEAQRIIMNIFKLKPEDVKTG